MATQAHEPVQAAPHPSAPTAIVRCPTTGRVALIGGLGVALLGCPPPRAEPPQPVVVAITPEPSAKPLVVPLPDQEGPSLLGTWAGVGRQSDGPTWPMKVKVVAFRKGTCAYVDYPSLGCAGQWECTVDTDGLWLRGEEILSLGQSACVDGGTVELVFDETHGVARFEWSGQGITAAAELRRPSRAAAPSR